VTIAPGPTCNIASWLPEMARQQPWKRAVVVPVSRDPAGRATWAWLTFAELDALSDRYAHALVAAGLRAGQRTVLMVKPSLDFFALVFALFKVGAPIVMIDPGLDRKALAQCLREVAPDAFIGIPLAHVARLVLGSALASVRVIVTVGTRWFWGGASLAELAEEAPATPFAMIASQPTDLAAILFTSGSTGVPKGACYSHGIFDQQVRMLRAIYRFGDDEIDLPTFPLFALFDPALGMTAVIPDMDARFPARADPAKIREAILSFGCTNMFASPALLRNLAPWCKERGLTLPSLRRVLSAGAPVPPSVLQDMRAILPAGAQVFTPYGATESLPVCNVGSDEVLSIVELCREGAGICVGRPVEGVLVRILRIRDDEIPAWSDDLLAPPGEVGEIAVRSPVVTESYWARPEQTALAKIRERLPDGREAIVHRMGDLGRFDDEGRLWMCGRKSHRVETGAGPLFTEPIEKVVETVPGVRRAALVGVGARGRQRAVVIVEPTADAPAWTALEDAVRARIHGHPVAGGVDAVLLHAEPFPVDVRHNAKIVRERLAPWAAERLGGASG
jgi:acyl-CoA synthetase (AMP-forming)/AMP-acid ligase II